MTKMIMTITISTMSAAILTMTEKTMAIIVNPRMTSVIIVKAVERSSILLEVCSLKMLINCLPRQRSLGNQAQISWNAPLF
jgi:hypothetical protein